MGQLQPENGDVYTGLSVTGNAYELARKDAEDENLLQHLTLR